jgi:hypothetical protein
VNNNGEISMTIYSDATVYSEEMIEGVGKEVDGDNEVQLTNETPVLVPSICRVYKYAPRYGFDGDQEDMVIFLTNKLEPKKYGG